MVVLVLHRFRSLGLDLLVRRDIVEGDAIEEALLALGGWSNGVDPSLLGVGAGAPFRGDLDSISRLGKPVSILKGNRKRGERTVSTTAGGADARGFLLDEVEALPAAEVLAAGIPKSSGALGSPRAAKPVASGIWKVTGSHV